MQPRSSTPPAEGRASLRALGFDGLRELVLSRGLPEYRFRQLARWLFDKGAETIDEMTDLPVDLRQDLARDYDVGSAVLVSRQDSRIDGASKYLFRLRDGGAVESVFMPTAKRVTLCISSQIGCTLDCIFCQTGRMGFHRNLAAHEIVEQIVPLWRRARGRRTRTNIVFMGMGEPLHNVREVVAACRLVADRLALNLGPKRITVSTAGVVPGIRRLAESGLGVRLAVSLNATTQSARERLRPRAAKTDLRELLRAARDYAERFRQRVTVEYVLLHGLNDLPEDADRLAALVAGGPFKINLIPYNPGAAPGLVRPTPGDVNRFAERLLPRAPAVTVRWSLGPDIAAACGQLHVEMEGGRKRTASPREGGGSRLGPAATPSNR
jgi:23S rRNA (adenine2503-C2)-methyltransferase